MEIKFYPILSWLPKAESSPVLWPPPSLMISPKDSKNAAVKHVAEKCKPVPDVTQRLGTSMHSRPEQMGPKK